MRARLLGQGIGIPAAELAARHRRYTARLTLGHEARRTSRSRQLQLGASTLSTEHPEDPCTQSSRPAESNIASRSGRSSRSSSSTPAGRGGHVRARPAGRGRRRGSIGRPVVAERRRRAEVLRRDRGEKSSLQVPAEGAPPRQEGPRQELTVSGSATSSSTARAPRPTRRRSRRDAQDRAPAARGSRATPGRAGRGARREARRRQGPEADAGKATRRRPARRAAKPRRPDEAAAREAATARPTADAGGQATPRPSQARREGAAKADTTEGGPRRADSRSQDAAPKAAHEEGRVDADGTQEGRLELKNGRDSVGQRLGVKAGDGQPVPAGTIIVRQRGMTFLAGPGTDWAATTPCSRPRPATSSSNTPPSPRSASGSSRPRPSRDA